MTELVGNTLLLGTFCTNGTIMNKQTLLLMHLIGAVFGELWLLHVLQYLKNQIPLIFFALNSSTSPGFRHPKSKAFFGVFSQQCPKTELDRYPN